MSEDSVTSTESIGSRIGNSFKGILVGVGFVIAAAALLWWNEGRSVGRSQALKDCQAHTVSVASDKVDAANEGKCIHISGRAVVESDLADPLFPQVRARALFMRREAEMYQWTERVSTSDNSGKTYSYSCEWKNRLINSQDFHNAAGHENPRAMPLERGVFAAEKARLGAFTLTARQVESLPADKELVPDVPAFVPAPAVSAPISLPPATSAAPAADDKITLPPEKPATAAITLPGAPAAPAQPAPSTVPAVSAVPAPSGASMVIAGKTLYYRDGYWHSGDPANPKVGDIRVRHFYAPEQDASVVAVQQGSTFAAYVAANGEKVMETKAGIRTVEEMFAAARSANSLFTWGLRFLGFVLMFAGFSLILSPLKTLTAIPFVGRLIEMGMGLVALGLAGGCSLLVIGTAWLYFRPLWGVLVLAAAAALIVWALKGRKAKS